MTVNIEIPIDESSSKYQKNENLIDLRIIKDYRQKIENLLKPSSKLHFLACSTGVFFFYLIYGFSQVCTFFNIHKLSYINSFIYKLYIYI